MCRRRSVQIASARNERQFTGDAAACAAQMDQAKAVYFVVCVIVSGRTPAEIHRLRTPRNHAERHLRARISITRPDLRADERIHILRQISSNRCARHKKNNADKPEKTFCVHVTLLLEKITAILDKAARRRRLQNSRRSFWSSR